MQKLDDTWNILVIINNHECNLLALFKLLQIICIVKKRRSGSV